MRTLLIRIWIASVGIIVGSWFVIAAFNERLAFDLAKSFGNGEASLGFWMKHGMPFWHAVAIGIACSTYDIFTWFCIFPILKRVYAHNLKPVYNRLYGEESITLNAETPWLIKAHRIGAWLYRFCIPQIDRVGITEKNLRTGAHYYRPLVLYGVIPGSIFYGVSYTLTFELNRLLGFTILALANAAKIIVFGYVALVMNAWIIFGLVLSTPFIRWHIEKYLRMMNEQAALTEEE